MTINVVVRAVDDATWRWGNALRECVAWLFLPLYLLAIALTGFVYGILGVTSPVRAAAEFDEKRARWVAELSAIIAAEASCPRDVKP